MSAPRIEVHIDELVLHGFPPGDGRAAARATQLEIARALAARGVANAGRIGTEVARAVGGERAPRAPSRKGAL